MTEEELAEIEARAAAVSANLFTPDALHAESLTILWLYDNLDISVESGDGVFLVNARTDILALIAEVRRLRALADFEVNRQLHDDNVKLRELLDIAETALERLIAGDWLLTARDALDKIREGRE